MYISHSHILFPSRPPRLLPQTYTRKHMCHVQNTHASALQCVILNLTIRHYMPTNKDWALAVILVSDFSTTTTTKQANMLKTKSINRPTYIFHMYKLPCPSHFQREVHCFAESDAYIGRQIKANNLSSIRRQPDKPVLVTPSVCNKRSSFCGCGNAMSIAEDEVTLVGQTT